MKFSVNLTALPGLTELLYRRRDDLLAGQVFVNTHATLKIEQAGLLNYCLGSHREVVAAVGDFLAEAAHFRADYLGAAVASCVTYYQRTDVAAAAALDATYRSGRIDGHPGVPQPSADQGLGPHIFDETSCSVGYPEPKDYHFEHPPIESMLDRASPTTQWREAVWEVTALLAKAGFLDKPVDIFGEFIEPLSGDWAAFRACADVWATVADRIGVNADWIGHGARVLPMVWTGNAATDCTVAVESFVADLRAAGVTIGIWPPPTNRLPSSSGNTGTC